MSFSLTFFTIFYLPSFSCVLFKLYDWWWTRPVSMLICHYFFFNLAPFSLTSLIGDFNLYLPANVTYLQVPQFWLKFCQDWPSSHYLAIFSSQESHLNIAKFFYTPLYSYQTSSSSFHGLQFMFWIWYGLNLLSRDMELLPTCVHIGR